MHGHTRTPVDLASFDADAAAYFAAVEGAGGSFDLTAINATYTASYVKSAHSTLFATLKTDGLWSKITELYLLVGKTFAGITIKAKGSGLITSVNFVLGDYVAAGSGAGLKGNGSTKYLDSNYTFLGSQIANLSLGVYATLLGTDSYIGARSASIVQLSAAGGGTHYHPGNPGRIDYPDPDPTTGFLIGTSGTARSELYHNGVSGISGVTVTTSGTPNSVKVFQNGSNTEYDTGRYCLAFVGTELTDTDAANLTNAVEAFMDAIGAGVILDDRPSK